MAFEIGNLKFAKVQKFCEKAKMPKLGTKNALCGCFWAKIFENYWHTRNQHPQICLIAKFCEKKKMLKSRIELVGYFSARILKNCYHIWNQHTQVCLIEKFREKKETSKLENRSDLLIIFDQEWFI